MSKTVQLSYLDGEIIVGSRDYPWSLRRSTTATKWSGSIPHN